MKKFLLTVTLLTSALGMAAKDMVKTICSPDQRLMVNIALNSGCLSYSATLDGKQVMLPSRLGLTTTEGDFTHDLSVTCAKEEIISRHYEMTRTKTGKGHYNAVSATFDCTNKDGKKMQLIMQISDNGIAYKYKLAYNNDDHRRTVITSEASSFRFPEQTTTFICPQSKSNVGWMQTKPSYEEEYKADAKMTERSANGEGYTFPCLFHINKAAGEKSEAWALVSESGVTGRYPASHISDYNAENGYTIAMPMAEEGNGWGNTGAWISLPGETPWRIITIGSTLKPIVETTLPYDVVEPLYKPSQEYKPGRYTWSWLLWQDNSVNYDDQIAFIDLAAKMNYEYCLVDGLWDKQIGRKNIEKLSSYAQSKGVKLLLWYNSNGPQNNAPQGPRDIMDNIVSRKQEMAWMKSIGVAGIKVDFFGSDKQNMMQLYEDILSDANDYGIQVIFHGCTLPRGWERMYPNYVSSEAVLASENLFFTQHHCDREGFELTMHPFCRNAVASMDWGGVIMNRRMSRDNKSGNYRRTSDVFEMASGIVNQASVQCVAIQPNNIGELPQFEIDWLKSMPTTWDSTIFISGYPGKYIIMARKHADRWILAGLNGTKEPISLTLSLPIFAGKQVSLYADNKAKKQPNALPESFMKKITIAKDGKAKITIQAMGGIIIDGK